MSSDLVPFVLEFMQHALLRFTNGVDKAYIEGRFPIAFFQDFVGAVPLVHIRIVKGDDNTGFEWFFLKYTPKR
jgi:hypothetical protein